RVFAIEQPPLGARLYVEIAQPGERSESMGTGPKDPEEESVATSVVTPQRFAKGMSFDQYLKYAGSPENLAREAFGSYVPAGGSLGAPRKDNSAILRERHARARLTEEQTAGIKWLAAQPNGPAKILVLSEDWSSDCRRDVPVLARLAEAGGMELRIFNRDGKKILGTRRPDPAVAPDANHDLMLEFMNKKNGGEWASLPVAVFYTKDFQELHRYVEYPAIYHKDRIRSHQQAARPGETPAETQERQMREFDHAGLALLRPVSVRGDRGDPQRAVRKAGGRLRACRGPHVQRAALQAQQLARDDDALDLAGALVDLHDLRVAEEALDGELARVAVAAQDLDRVGRDLHGRVGRPALGHGRLVGVARDPRIHLARRVVDHEPGAVHEHRHVGEHELDPLEARDRLTELLPLLRVAHRRVERRLADADRHRAGGRPR